MSSDKNFKMLNFLFIFSYLSQDDLEYFVFSIRPVIFWCFYNELCLSVILCQYSFCMFTAYWKKENIFSIKSLWYFPLNFSSKCLYFYQLTKITFLVFPPMAKAWIKDQQTTNSIIDPLPNSLIKIQT